MIKIKWIFYFIFCIAIGVWIAARLAFNTSSSGIVYSKTYTSKGLIYNSKTDKLFSGVVKDTAPSRILEYSVVNGVKDGFYKYYFLNGKLSLSGHMKNNKNAGEWIYYYENGQIESRGYFQDDMPCSKWEWYYPSGKVKEIGWYSDGNKEGVWKYYNIDGYINMQRSFIRNVIVSEIKPDYLKAI